MGYHSTGDSMRFNAIAALCIAVAMTGCANSNQKSETRTGYAIVDVPGTPPTDIRQLVAAVKDGLEKTGYEFAVTMDPPPSPLPLQPGRFEVVDPLGKSNLGALMAASGQSLKVAKCDSATLVASLKNDRHRQYGEDTMFVACVYAYSGGYNIDVWHRYSIQSGNLGASLARTVVGDSSQFIPRTIESIVAGVRAAGFNPREVERY